MAVSNKRFFFFSSGFSDSRSGDNSRGGSGRGGPVRSGTQGRSGLANSRGDPYPRDPPPSYVRERMESRGGGGPGDAFGGRGGHSSYGSGQLPPSSSSAGYGHQLSDSLGRGGPRMVAQEAPFQRGLDIHPHLQQQQQPTIQQNFYERSQNFETLASGRDFGGQPLRGPDPYQAQPSFGQA